MNRINTDISIERVRQVLEIYGAEPNAWPARERQAIQALINATKELQTLQQQALALDAIIDEADTVPAGDPVREQQLMDKIMQELPAQAANVTDLGQRTRRRNRTATLRLPAALSAVAASLIVFMVVLQQPDSVMQPDTASGQDVFEQWAWADVTGQAFEETQDDPRGAQGFMGLIDLESDEV